MTPVRTITARTAATVLLGLTLGACGTSSTSGSAPAGSTSAFCTVYQPADDKVGAAADQINPSASPQTVQAALDTIVSQAEVVLDASPSPAVKDDLQTFYNAVVEARSQVAAVDYDIAQLPGGAPAVRDPKFHEAAKAIEEWARTHCATPPAEPSEAPGS